MTRKEIKSPRIILETAVEVAPRGEQVELGVRGEKSTFVPTDAFEALFSRYYRKLFGSRDASLRALPVEELVRGFQVFFMPTVVYRGQDGDNHVLDGMRWHRREGPLLLPSYFVSRIYDSTGNPAEPR